jgi:hypothetical protein
MFGYLIEKEALMDGRPSPPDQSGKASETGNRTY